MRQLNGVYVRNPVRADLVAHPRGWPRSSSRAAVPDWRLGAEVLAPVREQIGGATTLLEIPRAQRVGLRPPLAALFASGKSRDDRDARCVLAIREHGCTIR